jgi:hypothetical protein
MRQHERERSEKGAPSAAMGAAAHEQLARGSIGRLAESERADEMIDRLDELARIPRRDASPLRSPESPLRKPRGRQFRARSQSRFLDRTSTGDCAFSQLWAAALRCQRTANPYRLGGGGSGDARATMSCRFLWDS